MFLRSGRALRLCIVAGACALVACGVQAADDDGETFGDGAAGGPLVAAASCVEADLCTGPAQVLPQCAAAAVQASHHFEARQSFDVPRAGTYDFVRLAVRRFFAADGVLQVTVRELRDASGMLTTPTVVGSGRVVGSLLPKGATSHVTVRFDPPLTLGLSNGATPRYELVLAVPEGKLSVGFGCASPLDVLASGAATWRKSVRQPDGSFLASAWQTLRRDLSLAIGDGTVLPGACSQLAGAMCDDGNETSGDGCSASCQVEAGYTCTGLPSACSTAALPCGTPGGPICGTNNYARPFNGGSASATSVYSYASYGPDRLIDGITTGSYGAGWLSADWFSGVPYPMYVTLDLGQLRNVQRIVLTQTDSGFYTTRDYTLGLSTDGTSYTDVASGTLPLVDHAAQERVFGARSARYVRVTITSGYRSAGYDAAGLAEIEVFGP